MPITVQDGRQYPLVVVVPFSFADFDASGVAEVAVNLPGVAQGIKGNLAVTTAFDSGTSDALDVGDGTTDDAYVAAQDGQAEANADFDIEDGVLGADGVVTLMWTGVGAVPTVGAGVLTVTYTQQDRANETVD